jgi:predicted RNase H-like HicB family nuclease
MYAELNLTSQGETLEEAEKNIKEAIELYTESFGTEDLPQQVSKPYLTLVEIAHIYCPGLRGGLDQGDEP